MVSGCCSSCDEVLILTQAVPCETHYFVLMLLLVSKHTFTACIRKVLFIKQ